MSKRYRVVGGSTVAGHPPGSVFEHDFPPHLEKALIAGGAIVEDDLRAEPEIPKQRKRTIRKEP